MKYLLKLSQILPSQCIRNFKLISVTYMFFHIDKNSTLSTCSESATARGPGQRVISFAFYKTHQNNGKLSHSTVSSTDGEFEGILENLKLVERYYPSYTMRLYTDVTEKSDAKHYSDLCDMFCNHPTLDICDVHNLGRLHFCSKVEMLTAFFNIPYTNIQVVPNAIFQSL